ncbi:hypothetical protein [Candidatus Villigracilis affinis]|uniref:hypothetical protein n=1 Tax=Candidatus Villigracilis affinis TaxID=3140682 RepID=UPI002A1C775D|nr:hypothetical protein [Anaerolineales bacterium]
MEEQFAIAQLHRVKIRVRAAEGAGCFFEHVAFQGIGTAVSNNTRRLVRQMFSGIHDLIFDRNFVPYMFAVFDFSTCQIFSAISASVL